MVGRGVTDLKSHELLFRFQFKGKKLALLCFSVRPLARADNPVVGSPVAPKGLVVEIHVLVRSGCETCFGGAVWTLLYTFGRKFLIPAENDVMVSFAPIRWERGSTNDKSPNGGYRLRI